jgi:uncharacterized protein (TIGR02231 family)
MERMELDSKVSAVTVYTDRAMVTRTAKAELDVGEAEITVSGLPAALDEYSFHVGGSGIAIVKVMSVELAREFRGAPPGKERTRLWKAVRKAEDEKRQLETQQGFLADKITFLKNTARAGHDDLSKTLARKRITVKESGEIIEFFFGTIDKLNKQFEKNYVKLREIEEELEKLRREQEKLESPRLMEGKSAIVRVEVSRGGGFDLELTYVVYGAGWTSGYDIRMDTETNKLQLDYRAGVMQQTGEDWDGVSLRLSTANPGLGANPPELSPAYVDFFYPMVSAGVPAAPMRAAKAEKEAEGAEMPEEFAAEVQAVAGDMVPEPVIAEVAKSEVTGEGPSVTYAIPGNPSVPSDGNPHIVAISQEEFGAELDYLLVPECTESAYIRAKAVNESGFVLLPGATNIYRDDDFVGRGALKLVNPGAEFECFLGADERIKGEYEVGRLDDDSAGIISNSRRLTRSITVKVKSDMNGEAPVVIKARRPVPRNKDIKLKSLKVKPKAACENDDGIIEWRAKLKPNAEQWFKVDYELEYPKDREIAGLKDGRR